MSITKMERAPGFPTSTETLEGIGDLPHVVKTIRDQYIINVSEEAMVSEDIWELLDAEFEIGAEFGVPSPDGNTPRITRRVLSRSKEARVQHILDLDYTQIDEKSSDPKALDQLTPDWSWTFETVERAIEKDVDGNPVVNSAGEVIEYTVPVIIPVLHIERFEETFSADTQLALANHKNQDEFWGADPGCVACAGIEDRKDSKQVFAGKFYRRVSYVFKFAVPFIPDVMEGWTDLVLDRGTYWIDESENKIHFKAGGSEITGNLDGNGGKLAEGDDPVLLRFNKLPDADFNAYDLGPYEE